MKRFSEHRLIARHFGEMPGAFRRKPDQIDTARFLSPEADNDEAYLENLQIRKKEIIVTLQEIREKLRVVDTMILKIPSHPRDRNFEDESELQELQGRFFDFEKIIARLEARLEDVELLLAVYEQGND